MAYTVLIPARLASSRLPNKPLADLGGLPMVVRVAQRAALSQSVVVPCGPPVVTTTMKRPVGSMSTSRMYVLKTSEQAEA